MNALLPKPWICVVYAAACAFLAVAFLVHAGLGHGWSVLWGAAAIAGVVLFARRARRLHREEEQQPVGRSGTGRP
ncbi:hypothetical protein [Rathayibacter sp. VKM Ac-2801]|uniref:hypothetical protein n=1 Tax=Rathayibacter sp. VKM Ac-2801 TaxID=2609255 RepID=UPI00131FE462|nr:hypothetical protein [Rathayibacter sp. VKM Ac-2801]QHC69157.1 hypothetical protein GSU45_01330 [Rathayibacter sp. VKM Ac-2801]